MSNDNSQAIQRFESQPMALDAVGRKAAIDDLLNKVALVQEVMAKVMHDKEHYGTIPGCGDKPALLKAGAEKLGMTFRLKASFEVNERDLGGAHREYSIRCMLSDGNMGVGSCSTMESKYRYRQGERKCPDCGKATIIVGKPEYGGGFICFAKKGGCGAKFASDDTRITGQFVGKVEHDNPADFYNTCLKMGKKRAHVDAIITATACSDIFTQDVEEMVQNAEAASPKAEPLPGPRQEPKQEPKLAARREPEKPPVDAEQVLPVCTVKIVTERTGTAQKTGKPWKLFTVLLNDGFSDMETSTFNATVGHMAQALSESGKPCEVSIRPGRKAGTTELVSIIEAQGKTDGGTQKMDFDEHGQPMEVTP